MTTWTDVSPSATSYTNTEVSPGATTYKELLRGNLYTGFTGNLYAGSLTVPFHGEADFYAGYTGVSPDSVDWADRSPDVTTYKTPVRGAFYAGNRNLYAGDLTYYAGYMSQNIWSGVSSDIASWTDESPDSISWTPKSPDATSWTERSPDSTGWTDV